MSVPDASLMYMIHHVFLPPKLPEHGDRRRFAATDRVLLEWVVDTLAHFEGCSAAGQDENIQAVHSMIKKMMFVLNDKGHIDEKLLLEALSRLLSQGRALLLYIQAQNAAVIIRKNGDNNMTFKVFELTPPNRAIMSIKGRLKRCFPGPAVAVPVDIFNNSGFQSTVANTLAKMSHQEAPEMKSTTRKADQTLTENRDTTSPQLVTEFLMSFLEAVGPLVSVPKIWKNTREEVAWSTGLLPWHRSPVWLLTRVAVQTTFSRLTSPRNYYKEFIVLFMAKIAAQAMLVDVPCDILHCLTSKISRRLSKLGSRNGQAWLGFVKSTLGAVIKHIQVIWDRIVANESDLPMQKLSNLNFKKDSVLQLAALDDYIQFVKQPPSCESLVNTFSPDHLTTSFPSSTLPVIPTSASSSGDIDYILAAFETWVSSHLSDWVESHMLEPATCGQLGSLTELYHTVASSHYAGNPENISLMLLTCLELWIACDKSATEQHPLMFDYSPEVPLPLLQSLVLPLKVQLKRLSGVEDYLKQREGRTESHCPSLFSTFSQQNSFAVRYYATSQDLQDLRASIEEWAKIKREAKKTELSRKKQEYNRLMNLYATSICEETDQWCPFIHATKKVHNRSSCTRCAYQRKASKIAIEVDEWPLPRAGFKAQATVFELKCPEAFNNWRDATLFLIVNVLKSEYKDRVKPGNHYAPSHCLSKFIGTPPQRLRIVSRTKPFAVTHYRSKSVSEATEALICVNNSLTYKYFDSRSGYLAEILGETEKIPHMCTYQLQHYNSLQRFIYRPHFQSDRPEHNLVISEQHSCPNEMSLEEFKALSSIPLGVRLQWQNILQQLSLLSIDFKKMDTTLVLLQVIRQAGRPSAKGIVRVGHQDLCDPTFSQQLLHALRGSLERIKEN